MKTNRLWRVALIVLLGAWLAVPVVSSPAQAQPLTYTVQKGDTLWGICEKFYGNPDLWPRLWSMNPFITNPHLLKAGDVLRLAIQEKEKKTSPAETPAPKPETPEKPKGPMGVDASRLTKVAALGFLSRAPVAPAGRIFSALGQGLLLAKGDIAYVAIPRDRQVNPGDFLAVYGSSSAVRDPLDKKKTGILVYFSGRMVVRGKVSENTQKEIGRKVQDLADGALYAAEILSSWREIHVGDPVMAWEPVSPCVRPQPSKQDIVTHIFAAKNLDQMIGQWSVVYLADGYRHGIRRGNVFEIIEKRRRDEMGKASFSEAFVGYLLVIESRPESASAVVISARREFASGATVRSIEWETAGKLISRLAECPLK